MRSDLANQRSNIQMKVTSVSDNQLLIFYARRLNEIGEMSTNVRLRAAVLCCNSDMLDIGTFGSNFITIARERKVDNFSTLLPELLIPLARAWNKPRIFIGLSAKQGRRSQRFMVLLRTFTLLTHQLRPEWDNEWHIYQLYWSASKLTCHTGGGTNSFTGANETPTRSLDGASQGFMSTPGKRKACDPSGLAKKGKRVKISAADLPEAKNSRRLAPSPYIIPLGIAMCIALVRSLPVSWISKVLCKYDVIFSRPIHRNTKNYFLWVFWGISGI